MGQSSWKILINNRNRIQINMGLFFSITITITITTKRITITVLFYSECNTITHNRKTESWYQKKNIRVYLKEVNGTRFI